jgi:aryl-alcohol dehydrogenase-like predicted oxidoreductase
MHKVELVENIYSSALGFGCAPVLGSVDANKSRRALECALYHGITHFDLARSYGYGEAEAFVGKILKPHRDKVVIASKFGISTNWKGSFLRPAKPLIRLARGLAKQRVQSNGTGLAAKENNNHLAGRLLERVTLSGASMIKSLHKSLQAIRTDYLDYFFIHEPNNVIDNIEEIFETAGVLKQQGKIRAFGIAYMQRDGQVHERYIHRFDVLQFDNSPGAVTYDSVVAARGSKPNVIFSPLKGGSNRLSAETKLSGLINDFPSSVILCSMFSETHIKANIDLFERLT